MLDEAVERLDLVARRWIDDVVEVKRSDVPPVLYHYTDATGLHGMLTGHKVWLTDHRFLNDRTEIIHTRNVAREAVELLLAGSPNPQQTTLYANILKYFAAEVEYPSLVFSLSELSDDLSQWRGYARDGMGFTLGFDGLVLQGNSSGPKGHYNFARIEYDHAKQRDALERALSDLEAQMREEIDNKSADEESIIEETARNFAWIVQNRGPVNKHASFKSEREWRLLEYVGKPGVSLKVRASGSRLVPYSELCPCPSTGRLPITRIGIGPSLSGSIDVHAVKALCDQTGYDPEIYLADAPYRRL